MNTIEVFDDHVEEYEEWFSRYPFIFQSEIEAIREMLPEGDKLSGIEIGVGTGRYSQALQIKEGIEPSKNMRMLAIDRGIETMDAKAESLPYGDLRFDFVLMVFCLSYLKNPVAAFSEAFRVLKNDGVLVVGLIDKDGAIGKAYEARKADSTFYKHATFYTVDSVVNKLTSAGFRYFKFCQTLFGEMDSIQAFQPTREGYGEGSFVVIQAMKKFQAA